MPPLTVFITGASKGLGLEFVKQILVRKTPPKFVFAACRDPSKADELQKLAEKYDCLKLLTLDVTKDSDIDSAVEKCNSLVADAGLNLLINNAGINDKSHGGFLEKQTRQQMQSHFDTNATAPVLVSQKFLPLLKKAAEVNSALPMGCEKAAIINISSIMSSVEESLKSNGNAFHYRMSKGALNMATALMSVELKPAGILVAALHPGWVQTDMGGAAAHLTVPESVSNCLSTIDKLVEKSSGLLFDHTGDRIAW